MPDERILNLFDRAQLFEEVWTIPMVHLGRKYGVSGATVRRACDALEIPIPSRGHWTRVGLGRPVERPALPPLQPDKPATADVLVLERESDWGGRRRRIAPRASAVNQSAVNHVDGVILPVRQPQKGSHRALAAFRRKMREDAARADRLRKRHVWQEAHPGNPRLPDVDAVYASWQHFCDAGQILLAITRRKLAARLSLRTYERGLSLLNDVCQEAESAGYAVELTRGDERLRLSKAGAYVDVRVTEKLSKGTRYSNNSWNRTREPVRTLTPTGKLSLFVEQQGTGYTELADLPNRPLEQQFERILETIDCRHRCSIESVSARMERERRWKEADNRRRDAEQERHDLLRKFEKENQRRQALISEIENWRQAELIRAYVASLDGSLGEGREPTGRFNSWREWALSAADDIDPARRRVGSLSNGNGNE